MRLEGVCVVVLLVTSLGCSTQDERGDNGGWALGPEVAFEVEGDPESSNNTSTPVAPDNAEEGPAPITEQPVEEPVRDPVEEPTPTACAGTLRTVTAPAEVEGTLPRGFGAVSERGCAIARGNEHAYTLRVERAGGIKIWTTWRGGETEFSPVLTLGAGCGDRSPTYCRSPLRSGPSSEYSGYIQAHLEPGDYVLTIDERSIDAVPPGGDYVLHIEDVELAEQATCESALNVFPDEWAEARFTGDGATAPVESCFDGALHAHYYSFDVPPRMALTVTVDYVDPPADSRQPRLKIASGCSESAEMCSGVAGAGVVSLANESEEYVTYTVAVDGLEDVEYVLKPFYDNLSEHTMCSWARRIFPGQRLEGEDFDSASEPVEQCNGDLRRSLYYSIDVEPGERLIVDVPGGQIRESCDAIECVAGMGYVNSSEVTESVIVQARSPQQGGEFSVWADTFDLAADSVCEHATRLEVGDKLEAQDIRAGGPGDGRCGLVSAASVYTRYFKVMFELGEEHYSARVRVSSRSQGSFPSIQVIEAKEHQDLVGPIVGCASLGPEWCQAIDDEYFRPTPVAEVDIEYDGGGRVYSTMIIAVTMGAADWSDPTSSLFDIEVLPGE